jgi:hypothetical protein
MFTESMRTPLALLALALAGCTPAQIAQLVGDEAEPVVCDYTVNDDGTWTPHGWDPADGFPPTTCTMEPTDGILLFEDETWKVDDGTWYGD